ncbi:MAG: peptidoglycan DD-metalloendopeptidase family protein [Elusimicrobia bacterium]|nr:peptidoglycan DD-metalloendopeptidase family protein [Elusimicrobiota bacterium]
MKGVLFILAALGLSGPALADYSEDIVNIHNTIESQQEEINSLEQEIGKYSRNLEMLTSREKSLLTELNGIDYNISEKKRKLGELQKDIDSLKGKIGALQDRLKNERKIERKYGSWLKTALRYYYYKKKQVDMLPWFSAYLCSVTDAVNSCFYAEKIVNAPARKYSVVINEIEEIEEIKKELEKEEENIVTLKREVIDVQEKLIKRKKEQLSILRKIESDRHEQEARLRDLQDQKEKLQELILSLKAKAVNLEKLKILAVDFEKAKGYLPWPVKGRVISRFGKQKHPQLDTYLINRGIKIKGDAGEKAKAVAGGEIVYAGRFRGMGNIIIIDHGKDYYSIYGELEDILAGVGEVVEPFREIGTLSAGVLYFELGKGSVPEDPIQWMTQEQ